MLARFLTIMIIPLMFYFLFYPMMKQGVEDAINCVQYTNQTKNVTYYVYESPLGSVDGFGGAGGNYKFGGYSGEVSHKDFTPRYITRTVNVTNNMSQGLGQLFNPNCAELTESQIQLLRYLPTVFLIGIFLTGIFYNYRLFRYIGDDGC